MLWQQSTVIFQMIGESNDSSIPDRVPNFVIQPFALLHADVSSPVNIGVLKKYWLNELMEHRSSFSLFASPLFAQYHLNPKKLRHHKPQIDKSSFQTALAKGIGNPVRE